MGWGCNDITAFLLDVGALATDLMRLMMPQPAPPEPPLAQQPLSTPIFYYRNNFCIQFKRVHPD